MTNGEAILINVLAYLPKVLFAVIGGGIALIFSGDIRSDGCVKIGWGIIIKLSASVALGIAIGDAMIFYLDWQHIPIAALGLVFLIGAALGMLLLGLVYRSVELTFTDKTLPEIIKEVKDAFFAVFGK